MSQELPVPAGTIVAGKYRIEQLLGVGGMGLVVRATHLALGQGVALKVLRTHSLSDVEARRRFMREARATFALKSPHTVRLLDVDDVDKLGLVMVMELLEGKNLRELIHDHAPLPEADAVLYARHVCLALAEAHNKGFIHRDIKPANLFLTEFEGRPWIKVLDFGLSKALEVDPHSAPLTAPLATLGTPRYMAPEQWAMPPHVDARSDLYSLGAVFYQMLTGVVPFADIPTEQRAARLMVAPVPSPRTLRPQISESVARIVTRLLRPRADERFASAEELERALSHLDEQERTGQTVTTTPNGAYPSLAATMPEIIELPPNTEREPGWDIDTTPRARPPFDVNVFTGARVHDATAMQRLSSMPPTTKPALDAVISSAAPFDLVTDIVVVPLASASAQRHGPLASTLRSEDGPPAGLVVPPPRAQPVEARSSRQLSLDPTQPRMAPPPLPTSTPRSIPSFLIAVAIAFLVGVGLAFLMVMRR